MQKFEFYIYGLGCKSCVDFVEDSITKNYKTNLVKMSKEEFNNILRNMSLLA